MQPDEMAVFQGINDPPSKPRNPPLNVIWFCDSHAALPSAHTGILASHWSYVADCFMGRRPEFKEYFAGMRGARVYIQASATCLVE